ncbi:MAG: NUDIX domain-containing protein [Patescibacteria group bacterium]|jgi:8-oxo-dGTP pyrophosphatase MutT (NUDIX family)
MGKETSVPKQFTDFDNNEIIRPDEVPPIWRPGAYTVVLNDRDEMLFLIMPGNPYLHLPGGGIDLGEQVQDAVVREAHEETGYSIELIDRHPFYMKQNNFYSRWTDEYFCGLSLFFRGRLLHDRQDLSALNQTQFRETEQVVWIPRTSIDPKNVFHFFREVIQAVLKEV